MPLIKYAETQFSLSEIHQPDFIAANKRITALLFAPQTATAIEEEVRQRFVKFAAQLKKIAPKASDFLYFSAIMLHAAEAALIDQETGESVRGKDGSPITAEWVIDKKGSWKWKCSNPELRPYKNNNGDIFPEAELKKAYRKWVGRPLCKDHQSSSVDGVRGIIVDTYWDDKFKRVIGLCALDKINYPDLARKVSTGYANNVSMGTAVGRSICYECGNIARVEAEYCNHVRGRTTYGEINIDLSPIELSLVVTGADPRAQLRSVIASLGKYSEEKQERIDELRKAGCVTIGEFDRLAAELEDLRRTVGGLDTSIISRGTEIDPKKLEEAEKLSQILSRSPGLSAETKDRLTKTIEELLQPKAEEVEPPYGMGGSKEMGGEKAQIGRDQIGTPPEYALEGRESRLASPEEFGLQINAMNIKLDAMQDALRDLAKGVQEAKTDKEGLNMSDSKLRERAAARRATFQKAAYFQGGGGLNEPQTYPVDPMNDKLKTDGDKQMEGQGMEPGNDGMHPGYDSFGMSEEALKKKLSRAELDDRKMRRHALMATAEEPKKVYDLNGKKYAVEGDKLVELKADDEMPPKQAYFQGGGGLNEPSKPGTPKYPVDPMNDKLKTDGDKQMEGQGMEPGNDGLHPGYKSYGDELKLKQKLLRADQKLRAKFVVAYKNDEGTVIDKESSRWEIYAGKDKVLEATGKEIYENLLESKWDVLASKRYGLEVIKAIREEGLEKVTYLLKGEMVRTAQEPPMPPMPPAGGPPAGGPPAGEPPAGEPPPGMPEPPKEEEKKDDKKPVDQTLEDLDKALEDAEKSLGDLKDALQETTGKAETELPSPAEADDDEADDCEADDIEQLAAAELTGRVSEVYSALDESADEIAMLAESLESRVKTGKTADAITEELLRLASDALRENEEIRSEAALIVESAKKKEKKEEDEEKEEKKGKGKKKEKKEKEEDEGEEKEEKKDKGKKKDKKEKKLPWEKDEDEEDEGEEKEEKKDKGKKSKAEQTLENLLKARAAKRRELVRQAEEVELTENPSEMDAFDLDEGDVELESLRSEVEELKEMIKKLTEVEREEGHPELQAQDLEECCEEGTESPISLDDDLAQMLDEEGLETTAEDRRAWRAKVAAEVGAKYQLKLDPATCCDTDMPLAESTQLGQLDTKPSDEGAKVESIEEQYEKIMREVESLPKVREALQHIFDLMKAGVLKTADLNDTGKLTALAVDPEAVKYFKGYFGLGDQESKQFAAEMVKEFVTKKASEDKETQRIRMRRAYDMALEMQDKGMIPPDVATLHKQVDEIMQFDDKGFESFKRALSRVNKQVKTAAPALQVGVNSSDELGEGGSGTSADLTSQLKKLW